MSETKEPSTRVLREIERKLRDLSHPAERRELTELLIVASKIQALYERLEKQGPQKDPKGEPPQVKLSEIRTERGESIVGWHFVDIDYVCRLFYEEDRHNGKGGYGFEFYAVGWCGGRRGTVEDASLFDDDPDEINVECLWHGSARFDGVRHLYCGDEQTDNEGYLYYPRLSRIAGVLTELAKLEKRFCNDPPKD